MDENIEFWVPIDSGLAPFVEVIQNPETTVQQLAGEEPIKQSRSDEAIAMVMGAFLLTGALIWNRLRRGK